MTCRREASKTSGLLGRDGTRSRQSHRLPVRAVLAVEDTCMSGGSAPLLNSSANAATGCSCLESSTITPATTAVPVHNAPDCRTCLATPGADGLHTAIGDRPSTRADLSSGLMLWAAGRYSDKHAPRLNSVRSNAGSLTCHRMVESLQLAEAERSQELVLVGIEPRRMVRHLPCGAAATC